MPDQAIFLRFSYVILLLTVEVDTVPEQLLFGAFVQEALLLHFCGADRLNEQYFAKRAFYQGVCDSFTRIRAGDDPIPGSTPDSERSMFHKCREVAERIVGRLRGRGSIWAVDAAVVWKMVNEARTEGWRFHQAAVAADNKLLAWVRRRDFIGADIREEAG